jgi:hypothetical protein
MSGCVHKCKDTSFFRRSCILDGNTGRKSDFYRVGCGGRVTFVPYNLAGLGLRHVFCPPTVRVSRDAGWPIRSLLPCSQNFLEVMGSQTVPIQCLAVLSSGVCKYAQGCWIQARRRFGGGPSSNTTHQFRITVYSVMINSRHSSYIFDNTG